MPIFGNGLTLSDDEKTSELMQPSFLSPISPEKKMHQNGVSCDRSGSLTLDSRFGYRFVCHFRDARLHSYVSIARDVAPLLGGAEAHRAGPSWRSDELAHRGRYNQHYAGMILYFFRAYLSQVLLSYQRPSSVGASKYRQCSSQTYRRTSQGLDHLERMLAIDHSRLIVSLRKV